MSAQHFLSDCQFDKEKILAIIALAKKIKAKPQDYSQALAGKSVVMLFEKPSLRTHISFDIGIQKLGGHAIYIGQQNGQLGARERVKDVAINLSCWSDAVVARVFKQSVLEELSENASVPVINALSDLYHPCQALADFLTIAEHYDDVTKVKLAYVGDGNNVAQSLLLLSAVLGVECTIVCPEGHQINEQVVDQAMTVAQDSGAKLTLTDKLEAITGFDVIYTDTWVSMGDETKVEEILEKFMPYQVNHDLMTTTGAKHFLHCQPAHLDQEITTALFDDNEFSLTTNQAENRMWAQNALLVTLLGEQ